MTYSPTAKLREPAPKSSSRARPTYGKLARKRKRPAIESIRRVATSMLALSLATYNQMSSRSASAPRRYPMRHLFGQFSDQAGASALPHFGSQFPHGFLRDDAAFATGKSSAGIVKRRQKRHAAAFALFPQRKRFPNGIFLAMQPASFHGATGECLLIGRKLHFHCGS